MARRTLFRTLIVKLRMFWADVRGHHGKVWDYEPGDYYMGSHKGHNKHLKKLDKLLKKAKLDKLKSKDFKRYGSARKLYNFKIDNVSNY